MKWAKERDVLIAQTKAFVQIGNGEDEGRMMRQVQVRLPLEMNGRTIGSD